MEKILTIFTPTYNRGYIIGKLYDSLLSQTNKNFKWLIVDDGSSDNTEVLVKSWIAEGKIEIKYIKQENQGKHIAHNTGVENCDTELFFCVDSDDYLLANGVEDILSDYKYISDDNTCGIVTSRIDKNNNPIGGEITSIVEYSSLSDLYEKYGLKGDTSLVFKSKILKEYKFPKINGEKFIGEEYIYCQIDERYKLYISQKKYYICEYLDDGYTKNIINTIIKNPKGYTLLKKMKLNTSKNIIIRYKSAALYLVGGKISNEKNLIKNSRQKLTTILAIPLAIIVYNVRFKKYIINQEE